ncbi:hypothetical protein GGF46_004659 [Coemansia sp. RSA 552]|nr:hypothetical protein GGF46_004659 [Coemansia sp. RSA 552]
MDYLGPIRCDDSSDDEAHTAPPTPAFVVRLKPAAVRSADTLVVSLVPPPTDGGGLGEAVGVVYAPASVCGQLPLGGSVRTNNALARVFQAAGDSTVRIIASSSMPVELQHGWVKAVAGRLSPKRIVLVDSPASSAESWMNQYRSPAVLAAEIVVGLAAAVINHADMYGIPCRHIRADTFPELGKDKIDALFAAAGSQAGPETADPSAALCREVATSLYV